MDAGKAFRLNLPALDSVEVVRDFIACVAQGMLLGAITGADGTRLVNAAQVADTSLRQSRKQLPPENTPGGCDSPSLRLCQ